MEEEKRYCRICGAELRDDEDDICDNCMAILGYTTSEVDEEW